MLDWTAAGRDSTALLIEVTVETIKECMNEEERDSSSTHTRPFTYFYEINMS